MQRGFNDNQPLFIFAVNKETDIIGATQQRKWEARMRVNAQVFNTFFSIKDHKRNNSAWLNQKKSRGQKQHMVSSLMLLLRYGFLALSGLVPSESLFSSL